MHFLVQVARNIVRRFRTRRPESNRSASPGVADEVAVLYHEIRNGTSTLQGEADLLIQRMTSQNDLVAVERIKRVAASIERIAREVMVLSDPGRLQTPVPLDLPGLIRECAEEHFPGCLEAFLVESQADLPNVMGDPGKLRQAFAHIFRNAFDAKAGKIRIQMAPAGNFLRILIEDDGKGCPPEDFGKIFLLRQTSKRGKDGSGLGLAMVKAIVESHGGSIWASACMATKTQGLGVHITLPTVPCPTLGEGEEAGRILPEVQVI